MTIVKRLRLLTAVLGVSAASAVIGTAVFGDVRTGRTSPSAAAAKADAAGPAADPGRTRFTDQPTLTYRSKAGKTAFAWQIKPTLPPAAARDRDVLVLVDTSASQAGGPLVRARHIIDGLAAAAAAGDTISVWTININDDAATRSLTNGFQPAASDAVRAAAAKLVEVEYAAGATDLKAGVEKALATFPSNPARQQVILFLGDGESAASPTPVTEAVRAELGTKLDQSSVAFFAVPLGMKINAHNLHGLATITGGAVVRLADDVASPTGRATFAAKLKQTFDVPVLRPEKVAFGPEVAEVFPTKLPPLRADRATLVVGTLKADSPSVTVKIDGKVVGLGEQSIALAERLPVPEADNYFLHAVLEQWKTAPAKDAPAILSADRSLALASQQFRLFREEFLSQAVYAISSDRLDHAEKLYEAALKIDPASQEADAGLKVVHKMRTGELTRDKIKSNLDTARTRLAALAQDVPPAAKPAPADAGAGRLAQAAAERRVIEDQYRVLVDDTIRNARQKLTTDPDTAYDDLKRQRDIVAGNGALGDAARGRLVADLEAMMQTVQTQGAAIKARAASDRERIARTRLRVNEFEKQQGSEEATRARVDAFKQLMNQARFEYAQQEAQLLIQERVSRGQTIPPEATGSYLISQSATNLREHRELVRIREDRYLLTMLQAEKSFIPYPDEPPVHFPPAAVWRELTAFRAERYSSGSLGSDIPPSMRRTQSILEGPSAQRVRIEAEVETLTLRDIIDQLQKEHDLKIIVLEDAFKAAGEANILEKKPTIKQRLTGLTVGSFLDITLQSMGATYVVRPEYIEITTIDNRLSEKVVRAFDVTDLIYQIPSSSNRAAVNQNQQFQNNSLAIFGQATIGGTSGALGNLGAGALGIGGIGIGGGLGGGLGGGIGGGLGGGIGGGAPFGGGGGGLGQQGGGNMLGAGGGVVGIGGGQIGQFGNLGGQFGIQGNNSGATYDLLILLIQDVVARGEWAAPKRGLLNNPNVQPTDEETEKKLTGSQLNSIGPFQPTRSLIVRGTGKYHPGYSVQLRKPEMGAMGPGNPNPRQVANAAGGNGNVVGEVGGVVAAAGKPGIQNPLEAVQDQFAKVDKANPAKMWQQAMDMAKMGDPRFIVAAADLMIDVEEPKHAAEILKVGIRRGIASDGWAHEALALAMQGDTASASEVERAKMSAVDLDPNLSTAYLKAAKAADENRKPELAVAFCQRAADLEPNQPVAYANALVYAEKSAAAPAGVITWATGNLLRRDWTSDGIDYHVETKARLDRMAKKFAADGRAADVDAIQKIVATETQRDLVVQLLWQGTADLDLSVTEPGGSTATATHKRTTGGGVLKCDVLDGENERSEVYTAAQAFSGTYTVGVKTSLGRPVGNKATVKVIKFQGTDREAFELFPIDLANPTPVSFKLDGGSRNEMASVRAEQLDTAPAALPEYAANATGFGGGAGTTGTTGTGKLNLPTLVAPVEGNLPGISPQAPGMRATATVSADRKTVVFKANPVFGSTAKDLPMPKVSLLPGAEPAR